MSCVAPLAAEDVSYVKLIDAGACEGGPQVSISSVSVSISLSVEGRSPVVSFHPATFCVLQPLLSHRSSADVQPMLRIPSGTHCVRAFSFVTV